MLGPDGVQELTNQLQDLTSTVEGLRNLVIGLAITNAAVFAIVLGLWQKLHPVEDEEAFGVDSEGNRVRVVGGSVPKITSGPEWPENPSKDDLHVKLPTNKVYRHDGYGWLPVPDVELVKGTVGGGD